MPEIHCWWLDRPDERYWLEVTDRPDLGINLKAPQVNERGAEFWNSLLRHVRPGDVVFHYDRAKSAIIAHSTATGQSWDDKIVWAALGTYAREAGIAPHERDGWYVGLESFVLLPIALRLDDIRSQTAEVVTSLADLQRQVGPPIYFPFATGGRRR